MQKRSFPRLKWPSCLLRFQFGSAFRVNIYLFLSLLFWEKPGASSMLVLFVCCPCVCESLMERSYVDSYIHTLLRSYLMSFSKTGPKWSLLHWARVAKTHQIPQLPSSFLFLIIIHYLLFISYPHKESQTMFILAHCGSQKLFMTEVTGIWPNL